MPIFEYLCEDCGTKFEKLVRKVNQDELLCPSCGQDHLAQQHSTFAARSNGANAQPAMSGGCPAGMCQTPGVCGRN